AHTNQTDMGFRRMGHREQMRKLLIAEAGDAENDCDVVEPGEIAAQDQDHLKEEGESACNRCHWLWEEKSTRHDQFDEVIEAHREVVPGFRNPVKVPAERIGKRLGFVVVEHAAEISPAGISPDLDHSGPEHDAKKNPSQKPDEDHGNCALDWS